MILHKSDLATCHASKLAILHLGASLGLSRAGPIEDVDSVNSSGVNFSCIVVFTPSNCIHGVTERSN